MLQFFTKIDPARFFIVAALVLGAVYFLVRPPMQSPDELNHFLRAYQVSEGKFLPEKRDKRLGGDVPVCILEFYSFYKPLSYVYSYRIGYEDIKESFKIPFKEENKVYVDFPNTSYYSLVAYAPQSLALYVLRQFPCSVGLLYHLSRLFMFLVWTLAMYAVIRLMPFYKWLFVLLCLLPMSLFVAGSYSADTSTNILTLLLIAYTLHLAFRTEKLGWKNITVLLVLGLLLAFTKLIYVSLIPLVLVIPQEKFGTLKTKYVVSAALFLISACTAWLWSNVIMQYYTSYENYHEVMRQFVTIHPDADYYRQLAFLKANKLHLFTVIWNGMAGKPAFYLESYVGRFGAFMSAPMPDWFFRVGIILIFFVALTERTPFLLSWKQKLILLLCALGTFSLLVMSQYLTWNKIGDDAIEALQGRYLVPILPLIFMLLQTPWSRLKLNVSSLVIVAVFTGNAYACTVIYSYYFKEWFVSKTEFSSGFEEIDAENRLKTSDPGIRLEKTALRSCRVVRNGRYSLCLPPDSIGAVYGFSGFRNGDLAEIGAWLKGQSAEIVLSGGGPGCKPYRIFNRDMHLTDRAGWKKMMLPVIFYECDSSDVRFYIHNFSQDTVYIDDVSYSVKSKR